MHLANMVDLQVLLLSMKWKVPMENFKANRLLGPLFGVMALLVLIAGCDTVLQSTKSVANAKNQRFSVSLVGNWALTPFKEEPDLVVTLTRKDVQSNDYIMAVRDETGVETCTLRLLEIGDYQFIETESTMPQERTINGKPFQTAYNVYRITETKDTVQLWQFKDKDTLNTLPQSDVVLPNAKYAKKYTIADCSADLLRKFLLENGGKMTEKFGEFTRRD